MHNRIRQGLLTFTLWLAALATLFPFFWMLSSSLKPRQDIFAIPPIWFPRELHFENYTQLFTERMFDRVLLNSFFTSGTVTVGALLISAMSGFAFAKYSFKLRDALFLIVLGTLMIPMETGMVPLYIIIKKLQLVDSLWGVILPRLASGFGIFYIRQYAASISEHLLDAARVEGCSEFKLFFSVILPILQPALASLGIIFFIEEWNNFVWPTIILRSQDHMTIAVAIRALESGIRTPYQLIMSGSVISIIPMIVCILLFHKKMSTGMVDGAVKG